jgi:uroporphyrinogen-III synthase
MAGKPLLRDSRMPQNKISILSTRSLDVELIRDAEAKEILVDVLPFIKTESISSDTLQRKIHDAWAGPTTIVFTSANAVEAIASKIKDQKTKSKIFCIGYGTRRSVEKYFGEGSIAGVANNAKELAEAILRTNVSDVIFFCGDQRRDELPDQLKKNNIEVTEIVVYKTILTPQKTEKEYDGILFFSPSAVKSFFQLNKVPGQTVLFAIGNTTANEIKRFSKNKIMVSDVPTKETLIDNVISYFQINPIHH